LHLGQTRRDAARPRFFRSDDVDGKLKNVECHTNRWFGRTGRRVKLFGLTTRGTERLSIFCGTAGNDNGKRLRKQHRACEALG
jgi:hypothetical protein